jgi:membrane-bound metal-dependent hydrolase YbcI (DUF457 family)
VYVFGHVGLTLAAARAVDRDVDLRWAALLAVGPDLLDKPGARLWPTFVNHNSRGFGHTMMFALLVFAALLVLKRPPRRALVLWGCYVGHFLLDSMWMRDNPVIFLWPMLGDFPAPVHAHGFTWMFAWYMAGEIAGLAILARLGLFERARFAAFLKSGRLP